MGKLFGHAWFYGKMCFFLAVCLYFAQVSNIPGLTVCCAIAGFDLLRRAANDFRGFRDGFRRS